MPLTNRFTSHKGFVRLEGMLKRMSWVLLLPLLLSGCTATLTNLTPQTQLRNENNLYPVEVALSSRQQTMRWNSINPTIMVGDDFIPMRPTPLLTNRWEGLIPVPAGTNLVHYRYKFDYHYNAMGAPKTDSALSPIYTLRIIEEQ